MAVSTDVSKTGRGNPIGLTVLGSNPATVSSLGQIYTKTISGNAELFYMNSAGTVEQLTTGSAGTVTSVTGTANQVITTAATGAITLSTPQDIGTASSPTFGGLTLTGTINIQNSGATQNAQLLNDGQDILALQRGANAQTFRVYGTTTGPKYLSLKHNGIHGFIDVNDATQNVYLGGNANSVAIQGALLAAAVDNSVAVGSSGFRFSSGYFGTSVSIGTNPAAAGDLRLANAAVINFRNAANSADLTAISINASNQVALSLCGNQLGTATTWGIFAATPVAQQNTGITLTNSVTSGGTLNTIANFTDLSIYANDSAAIRNNFYQITQKLKLLDDKIRLFGLLVTGP